MADVKTGNGSTLTFSASGYSPTVIEINGFSQTLEAIQDENLAMTGNYEYCPADLAEIGEVTARVRWDNSDVPTLGTAETITITFPLLSLTTPANVSGTAFITGFTSPNLANNQLAEAEFTFQFDGGIGPTWTAEV